MSDVLVYEQAAESFADRLAQRGHHVIYRLSQPYHCPGCGRSQWYVGRISAECGFCGTALPLAEARYDDGHTASFPSTAVLPSGNRRRHRRMPAKGRSLQLLINGSPTSFAIHNVSEGGAMGVANLDAGVHVQVRFESGIVVPAVVKWCEDGLVGVAFESAVALDGSSQSTE